MAERIIDRLTEREVYDILTAAGLDPREILGLTNDEFDEVLEYIFDELTEGGADAVLNAPDEAVPDLIDEMKENAAIARNEAPSEDQEDVIEVNSEQALQMVFTDYVQTLAETGDEIPPPVIIPFTQGNAVMFMIIVTPELTGYAAGTSEPSDEVRYQIMGMAEDIRQQILTLGGNITFHERVGHEVAKVKFLMSDKLEIEVEWEEWKNLPLRGIKGKTNAKMILPAEKITRGLIEYIIFRGIRALGEHSISKGYNMTAILGAFARMEKPGPWHPMKDGEINCFVVAAIEHLKKRKKRRGHKDPVQILREFGEEKKDTGVKPEDVYHLESMVELKFKFWDWCGNLIGESPPKDGKQYKVVNLVRHNGHCFDRDAFPEFPDIKEVITPKEFGWHTGLSDHKLLELTGASGKDIKVDGKLLGRVQSSLFKYLKAKGKVSTGARVWAVGTEVITSDGVLCRDLSMSIALNLAEIEEERLDPTADDCAERHVGGPSSYRFKFWKRRNGLKRVADKFASDMVDAMVEARVWNSKEQYDVKQVYELDLKAAYLGCEDPSEGRSNSACEPYLLKYRMPHADSGMKWYRATNLKQAENIPGSFVRFATWELQGHEFVSCVIGKHLKEKGIIPTPLAIALRDLGYLRTHTLSAIAVPFEAAPLLKFLDAYTEYAYDPNLNEDDNKDLSEEHYQRREKNKELSRHFVGKCVAPNRRSVLFTDRNEAIHYNNLFMEEGKQPSMIEGDGMWNLSYNDGHVKYPHVRAYVLAYMHIAVIAKLVEHPDAVRVACDALTIPGQMEKHPAPDNVKYGVWRVKSEPHEWESFRVMHSFDNDIHEYAEDLPKLPEDGLADAPLIYLDGQGGSGKTCAAIRSLSGLNVVVLGKDHIGVRDLKKKILEAKEEGTIVTGWKTGTYQKILHIGYSNEECPQKPACKKCISCLGWNGKLMGAARRGAGLPDYLIWDEVGFVHAKFFRPILEYFRDRQVRVICAADILGQIRQFRDRSPEEPENHKILLELGAKVIFKDGDMRAKCPKLRSLKKSIWRQPDEDQISGTSAALREIKRAGKFDQALAEWNPKAMFAVSTRAQGACLQKRLLEEHVKRFPTELMPMRLKLTREQKMARKKGDMVFMPGNLDEKIKAVVGTRIWVEPKVALHYLKTGRNKIWVYDGWRTLHSLQGLTIEEDQLFVIAEGLDGNWNRNACYTAVSRVRYLHQLYWVTGGS